ncbi:MAG: NAD(P)/FAD-dependent oxidoreductase [Gemmatimonadetes bacterium]|nr:NAD(P)/FAD-dependent oxidoreductase [Gemmatimonadota bacterium]
MERHEVIVVGAGPAGSVAATVLAQGGRDVLLLDRTRFPRDKACGDLVPQAALSLMLDLGVSDAARAACFYPVRRLRIAAPGDRAFEVALRAGAGLDSCVVRREVFDAMLWEHAKWSGARFRVARVEEPVVERGRVVGVRVRDESEIRAELVIAADGATSAIARALRATRTPDRHRAVALRAYVDGLELVDHLVEVHYARELLPGYGWIFPVDGRCANVGVGMRLDLFRRRNTTLRKLLDEFLRLPSIAPRLGPSARVHDVLVWQLNFGSEVFPRIWDGALLIGDAGGFVSPLTGGGIHNAMITGVLAGHAAMRALAAGDASRSTLRAFERAWRRRLWVKLWGGYWAQRWITSSPQLLDGVAALLACRQRICGSDVARLHGTHSPRPAPGPASRP